MVSAEGEHRLILINLSAVFTSRIYDTMKSNVPRQPVHLDQSEKCSLVCQISKSKLILAFDLFPEHNLYLSELRLTRATKSGCRVVH